MQFLFEIFRLDEQEVGVLGLLDNLNLAFDLLPFLAVITVQILLTAEANDGHAEHAAKDY